MSAPSLTLTLERLDAGGLRITSAALPKWCAEAHGVFEIAKAIGEAWVEADIAAYARARKSVRDVEAYDDAVDDIRRMTTRTGDPEPDVTPRPELLRLVEDAEERVARARPVATYGQRELDRARQWAVRGDGQMWRSPAGRWFRADSEHVRRIAAILTEHGEDPRVIPDLHVADGRATVHSLDQARHARARRQRVEELI